MNLIPVLILDKTILLPSMELRMDFDGTIDKKIFSMSESYYNSNILIVHHELDVKKIKTNKLPKVGTLGVIKLHIDMPNGKTKIVIEGLRRVKIDNYLENELLEAETTEFELGEPTNEEIAYLRVLYNHLEKYMHYSNLSEDIFNHALSIDNLDEFVDLW